MMKKRSKWKKTKKNLWRILKRRSPEKILKINKKMFNR